METTLKLYYVVVKKNNITKIVTTHAVSEKDAVIFIKENYPKYKLLKIWI